MAQIDSAAVDASAPPEYSDGDPPQPSLPTYANVAIQTDPPVCHCMQLTLTVPINPSDGSVPCAACGVEAAIAAINLRCGHSICAFHLSFFIDGLRTWQAQQGLPPALPVSHPSVSVPSTSTALDALSPQSDGSVSSELVYTTALMTSTGIGIATEGAAFTIDNGPNTPTPSTSGASSTEALGETTAASTTTTSTDQYSTAEDDSNPFINPDPVTVAPPLPPQSLALITPTLLPAAISTPVTPAQAPASQSSRSSSPDSTSSGSSSTSYDSWTASEAALAHAITAAFEQLEFGGGAQAPNEELVLGVGENEAEQEGVANGAGQEDVVVFPDPDSDIEMVDA